MTGLDAAVRRRELEPSAILAILGKTEGNGCVNDFTRGFATMTLRSWLRREIGIGAAAQVALVMSGGTEGALSPHWLVLEARASDLKPGGRKALAIGRVRTAGPTAGGDRPARPDTSRGRAVGRAMAEAGINDPADVHLVAGQMPAAHGQADRRGDRPGCSCGRLRTPCAPWRCRVALRHWVWLWRFGELAPGQVTDDAIGVDARLWCSRASCSAGSELLGHEIVVLGMSRDWRGPLAMDHAVMADALDVQPVRAAMARLGLTGEGQLDADSRGRLVALLAKVEASHDGAVRGSRHVMLDDSDISATRHARAFVGGVLAGLVGHTELFVSGGAEHQGPDGGGPVAIIARSAELRRAS